jgi:TetR/AcrR family transcriptional regulator, mexJK operon transcriptional repressor
VVDPGATATRSAGKRQAITAAATRIFLEKGFQDTSMEEIAGAAKVSKQTVYKQFTDKKQLLFEIVLGITGRAGPIAGSIHAQFGEIVDVETGLTQLARTYAAAVLSPEVMQLRRLIVSEASRFPDLARAYYEEAPQRGLEAIATGLRQLSERGLLGADDAVVAANHFAYLVLGPLIDRAMFFPHAAISRMEIERCADAGAHAFLAAYGVGRTGASGDANTGRQ